MALINKSFAPGFDAGNRRMARSFFSGSQKKDMEEQIFDIEFNAGGRHFKGWVNPSDKLSESGRPVSFHVVLDNVSFGYVSFHAGQWVTSEQRPDEITKAVGMQIEKYYS